MSRLDQIQKMLELDSNDVFLNFALAMEYAKQGRSEDAISQFGRVAQLDRKYVPAYFQKANLLVSLERKDDARQTFAEALVVAEEIGDKHAAAEIRDALSLLK